MTRPYLLFISFLVVAAGILTIILAPQIGVWISQFQGNETPTVTATIPSPTLPSPTAVPTAQVNTSGVETEPAPSSKYAVYDNFSTYRSDIWTKSDYKPRSLFIDTTFKPSNIYYLDGKLVLMSYVDQHEGSELKSIEKFSYGRYRASIKLDQTEGTYLTFFSYQWETGANRYGHNECDFEFFKTGDRTTVILSTFRNDRFDQKEYTLPFDPSKAYHVYEYDWYPDRVEFYIDNKTTPEWVSNTIVPDSSMYIYFQNWVKKSPSDNHGDGVNTEYVDWVTYEPF